MNKTLSKVAARKQISASASFAANAGASVITAVPVPKNCMVLVTGRAFASAGALNGFAVTADASTDALTKTAHGVVTGTPVFLTGTAVPTGTTENTVYYARAATADTITLYDTEAHAVSGGGTGLVDITAAGTAVKLYTLTQNAAYTIQFAGRNLNGTTALIGSADLNAFEEISAWDLTVVANDTNDTLEVKGTPDATLATRFYVDLEVTTQSVK